MSFRARAHESSCDNRPALELSFIVERHAVDKLARSLALANVACLLNDKQLGKPPDADPLGVSRGRLSRAAAHKGEAVTPVMS